MIERSNGEGASPDLIIAGGGMVGASLACALADAGLTLAVVEARMPASAWPADEVDLRVSALTRASQRFLENLGVWKRMQELRVSPYREMRVWDATGRGRIHFDSAALGEPDLGHIVENRVIQLALWERLDRLERVQIHCPAAVADLDLSADGPAVVLDEGTRIRAPLVVAADGSRSPVREMAGIGTRGWAYDQHAVVATVRPARSHRETAWQRFMPSGPLAFLPIDDGRCSIVWSTSPEHARKLLAMDEESFRHTLAEASERVLGEILEVGPRAAFPLRLQHAGVYVRPGLALVGDAAHAIHPLAGQGVNLGFLDAATLAEVLVDAKRSERGIGRLATLRRYERARKGANLAMLAAMDGLKRLFSNELPPLRLLRNLGLSLTDASPGAKRLLMRRALGLSGELPRLARTFGHL